MSTIQSMRCFQLRARGAGGPAFLARPAQPRAFAQDQGLRCSRGTAEEAGDCQWVMPGRITSVVPARRQACLFGAGRRNADLARLDLCTGIARPAPCSRPQSMVLYPNGEIPQASCKGSPMREIVASTAHANIGAGQKALAVPSPPRPKGQARLRPRQSPCPPGNLATAGAATKDQPSTLRPPNAVRRVFLRSSGRHAACASFPFVTTERDEYAIHSAERRAKPGRYNFSD